MSANDKQVSGDHYKTSYQHWDMIVAMGYGPEYYIGQITKYITRWRKKNGLRDLRKGQHFLEKLIELAEVKGKRFLPYAGWSDDYVEGEIVRHMSHLTEFFEANEVDVESRSICVAVMFTNRIEVLKEAHAECEKLALAVLAKGDTVDAETPISRDFEFEGYEDDTIKWKCKKCGEQMVLGLMEPPIKAHKNCATVGS